MTTMIMDRLSDSWSQITDKYSDPRVKDWPLMQSPLPTMAIVFAYVVFVKRIGPQMMKHRKPYEMRSAIIAYNLFQVILSTYIFYNGAVHGWLSTYSWRCEPLNRSTTGSPMQVMQVSLSRTFFAPFTCNKMQSSLSFSLSLSNFADLFHIVRVLSEQVH